MFTGLITHIAKIININLDKLTISLSNNNNNNLNNIKLGESIALNGVCLTVTNINNINNKKPDDLVLTFDISPETFNKTNFNHTISHMSFYILFLVFLFAFLHICSQGFMSNAIRLSPNVGYCHLIVNLNIIVTLIASYFLFKQKFNIKSFIGIIIAIVGTSIVIYYSNE